MTLSTDGLLETRSATDIAKTVVQIEIDALARLKLTLNESFNQAIEVLESCSGRVIMTGMGKSGIIGRKIAATFSSTGTPAYFLHPGEGVHGDLGLIQAGDVVIAISNSGETPELLQVLPTVKHFNLPLIAMTGNSESTLAKRSLVVLDVSVEKEACALNLAPTASTTVTLVLGDALAVALMERKGFTEKDFAVFHPAGSLGKRLLLTVEDVMHSELPLVHPEQSFREALVEITEKKLGMTLVVDQEGLTLGILTDGDVRRILTTHQDIQTLLVQEVFAKNPKQIDKLALAAEALHQMQQYQITTLVVNDSSGKPEGIVHLHDLLKTGL
jgi:arabinose-5-phosphate isomerase